MQNLRNRFEYIFIDADDTLWENEAFFRKAEAEFAALVAPAADAGEIQRMLWDKQEEHIPSFGYGSKTYFMAMTEAALELHGGVLDRSTYDGIKKIIKDITTHTLVPFDGVEDTLSYLSARYKLILATKGESVEQLDKLERSGLGKYFLAREVMRNKSEKDYRALAAAFGVRLKDMLMIWNSVKSDVLPVINIGGNAILVPHENVWVHELADAPDSDRYFEVSNISDLKEIL